MKTLNDYLSEYGEQYRKIFTEALNWLDENEPRWKLKVPIDRDIFVNELTRTSTNTRK